MDSAVFKALKFSAPIFVILILISCWNPKGNFWGSVEPPKAQCEAYDLEHLLSDKVLTSAIYDQRKLDRLFREPQNTVSNIGYITAGLAILFASRRWLTGSLGVSCIFLGIGSSLYHASLLPEWRLLDILGVYAALFSVVVVGAFSVFRITPSRRDFAVVILTWIFAVSSGIHRNDVRIYGLKPLDSTTVVVAAVICGVVFAWLAIWKTLDFRRYLIAAAMLGVSAPIAFFGGAADRFGGVLATPEAPVQGHSIWHFLGAVALLASYEIFASTGFDRSTFEPDLIQTGRTRSQRRRYRVMNNQGRTLTKNAREPSARARRNLWRRG